ncbi:MAG: glycosyltransferase family 4 protein [Candidatus Micrarchaeota archaeon]
MKKKILFIHTEKKFKTGAHYISETIIEKLKQQGYVVDRIYPNESIDLLSRDLSGIANILLFYSLIKKHEDSSKYSLIQGTTYTPLAFIGNGIPVISHFGSTTWGFLKSVPSLNSLEQENRELGSILRNLYENGAIPTLNDSLKPLKDISKIEIYVAKRSDAVIAASEKVRIELIKNKVPKNKLFLIHNAIEDYWFDSKIVKKVKKEANLVYLGRLGNDPFTAKLKGVPQLIFILKNYPSLKKVIIGMCHNTKQYEKIFSQILNTTAFLSVEKRSIPPILKKHYGDLYVNTSGYEGFCLSLIEAMSQGLVPVVFNFGVAPEIIENGKNGYIVKDLGEMIQKINELKSNFSKRKMMAERAMHTVRQFNSATIIKQYIELYNSLMK